MAAEIPEKAEQLVGRTSQTKKLPTALPYGVTLSFRDGETMKIVLDLEWANDGGVVR